MPRDALEPGDGSYPNWPRCEVCGKLQVHREHMTRYGSRRILVRPSQPDMPGIEKCFIDVVKPLNASH